MTDTPIESSSELEPSPKRPGWPKTVGILSIVFSSLVLVCGGAGLAMVPAMEGFFAGMMESQLNGAPPPPTMPPTDAVFFANGVILLVRNAFLLIAGVMTLKRKGLGRTMHLIYALVGVLSAVFGSYASVRGTAAQQAEMEVWLAENGDTDFGRQMQQQYDNQQQMQGPIQIATVVGGLSVSLAWPVFCMIWFGMVKRTEEDMGGHIDPDADLY